MPDWKQEIRKRLTTANLSATRGAEIVEEFSQHLEDRYRELISSGCTTGDAYNKSLAILEGSDGSELLSRELPPVKPETAMAAWAHGATGGNLVEGFFQDLRYGIRISLKQPGVMAIAILTLMLGIGVNTALFTIYDAFVLKPLPLKDPYSLIYIRGLGEHREQYNLFSYQDYLDYSDRATTLSGLIAMNKTFVTVGEARASNTDLVVAGKYAAVPIGIVSANYFTVLGAEMQMGRGFSPEEGSVPGMYPVVVLSYRFWQQQFNGDPAIIGKSVKLKGQPFSIIGVTTPEFIGTDADAPYCWIPLMMRDAVLTPGGANYRQWLTDRSADSFVMIGRLKPGISQARSETELSVIAQQLARQFPDRNRKVSVATNIGGGFITLTDQTWPIVFPVLVAVVLVLLIACANVANLLLARGASRQKEIGMRLALGASRARVIRQLLTESLLISVFGGAAGLLLANWALDALYPVVLSQLPIPIAMRDSFSVSLAPDYRIFAFAMVVSVVAGLAAGLAPALQVSRLDLNSMLSNEGSTLGRRLSQSRLRSGLVVTQIAVSFMLLVGAGLLLRNVQKLRTIDVGFDTKNVVAVSADFGTTNASLSGGVKSRDWLAERLRTFSETRSLSAAMKQPLSGSFPSTTVTIPGPNAVASVQAVANYNRVSSTYFETMGIRLTRGRTFTDQEANSSQPVVVVNESTARRFWPNEDAVGKQIIIGESAFLENSAELVASPVSYQVVGIVNDTRSAVVWRKDETYIYIPLQENDSRGQVLLARMDGNAANVMDAVRGQAETIDPNAIVSKQRTADSLDIQMMPFRVIAIVAGSLGSLALLLASIGLYGVMSFLIMQRTREIGIRVALGAEPRAVLALFLKQGLKLIAAGTVIGTGGGMIVSRVLQAALVNLSPYDPVAFGGVAICLTFVAMLATYVPARRATKVDPMVALRYE